MAKIKLLLVVICLMFAGNLLAQNLTFQFVQSACPVNRTDQIVWADVRMSNDMPLKDLKFDVKLSYTQCTATGTPIPARMTLADGNTKDETKWSKVTDKGNGISEFHYWMEPNNPQDYLTASAVARKIMEFYVKFQSSIPDCGKMTISCSNFRAVGINGQSQEVAMTVPSLAEIIINFGECAPPPTPINLSADAQVIRNSQINELVVQLDYQSANQFSEMSFDLTAPVSWTAPNCLFVSEVGSIGLIQVSNNMWRVTVKKAVGNFSASDSYKPWLTLNWSFPPAASGIIELTFNNFLAKDVAGLLMPVMKELKKTVDLGVLSSNLETVKFSLDKAANWFSMDGYKPLGYGAVTLLLEIDNQSKPVHSVTFRLIIPMYLDLKQAYATIEGKNVAAVFKQLSNTTATRTLQVTLTSTAASWPVNQAGETNKELGRLVFGFTDLPAGPVVFSVSEIVSTQPDGQVVNQTKAFDYVIDFSSEFYRFKKGDSNHNFGDGVLNQTDLKLLQDYVGGRFSGASLYQKWAFDVDGNGAANADDIAALMKLMGISSVDEESLANQLLWPNPSQGIVNLRLAETDHNLRFVVYDLTGNIVSDVAVAAGQNQLRLNLVSGAYYWRISGLQPKFGVVVIE
ncbi:MAG: T9SS type A sorting domain-containing protein [Candidatus Falkowbacteria bacterium]